MLGLKSFRTAAITFAGVELAYRIRKPRFPLPTGREAKATSLKELCRRALGPSARQIRQPAAVGNGLPEQRPTADPLKLLVRAPQGRQRAPRGIPLPESTALLQPRAFERDRRPIKLHVERPCYLHAVCAVKTRADTRWSASSLQKQVFRCLSDTA